MSIPTQCLSGRIQGCAHKYYMYTPYTAGAYIPYTTRTNWPYQTIPYPTWKPCLTYTPLSPPTATATMPATVENPVIQEGSSTFASLAIACLLVLFMLLLLLPILFPNQILDTISARLNALSQEIRSVGTTTSPHEEEIETSWLEEDLVNAQNKVAMLEQEITDQREECTALQKEISQVKGDNALLAGLNLSFWKEKRRIEARYKDLLANCDELVAHNHDLNKQNRNLSLLNADSLQLVRDLETRNEHLERENVNWKESFHAIHSPPALVSHTHSTPSLVSSPSPLLSISSTPINPSLYDRHTAALAHLADLKLILSHKETYIQYLKEERGDFEAEKEWRDEMIALVEEELAEAKGMVEWYRECVDEMGRWALWEGRGFQEGHEWDEWDRDEGWEESESELEEVVVRDFEGAEEGVEPLPTVA